MSELKFYEYSAVKNPKYLVVFLHGYGSNGENLLDLAYEFKDALPEAHFISPNAVEPWEGGFPNSYQWFSLSDGIDRRHIDHMAASIIHANKILGEFISEQLKRFNLKEENLFIVGFSQGAMMAIYQGFVMEKKSAGIVGFSGRTILPEMLGEKTKARPPVCLIHGELDSVVPFACFTESQKLLTEQKILFDSYALPNLDHSIDLRGIKVAKEFIKKQIA